MINSEVKDVVLAESKLWLEKIVIAHNFCPFAKKELEKDNIRFEVIEVADKKLQLEVVYGECRYLDQHEKIETSLLVFPNGLSDFDNYLDMLALANDLLYDQGYEGVYQLASFHPNYVFEGESYNDAANYTNRSPYPMLHLLREDSLESALKNYPNPESIPENNITNARSKGCKYFDQLLKTIKAESCGNSFKADEKGND